MSLEKIEQIEKQEVCRTDLVTPFKRLERDDLNWVVGVQHSKDDGIFGECEDYGYDFLIKDNNGDSFNGKESDLKSYFVYGKKIVSPGDGKIVWAKDGTEETPIFLGDDIDESKEQQNYKNPGGNSVIIDHGNGEYSFIAHLKTGSLKVLVGESIKQGDELGRVGNSGNSSEPHIHYHMFKMREGFTVEKFLEEFKKPYSFLNLKDEDRNEEGFEEAMLEIERLIKENNIKDNTPVKDWPDELKEKFSSEVIGSVGVKTVFQNIKNEDLKKRDKVNL